MAEPCPRCGRSPVEVTIVSQADPVYYPACSCYPHPPRCPFCRSDLADERCMNRHCWFFTVLIPVPDIDPLYVA